MITEEQIGPRLKKLRIERGLTIAALASRTGFTKGYLSRVENSRTAPPVSTLLTMARALGVNINEVFSTHEAGSRVTVVKKGERSPISRSGSSFGYSYIPLAPTFPNRHMDPYIIVVPHSARGTKVFQHAGEQMMLVLEGTLVMKIGDQEYMLEEGDSIYFDSSLPHSAYVRDEKAATCVMVVYDAKPRTDGEVP